MAPRISGGTIHKLPSDVRSMIAKEDELIGLWESLTGLGRNEFICWIDSAKQDATRAKRIARTREELLEGNRRPCCWPGCPHHNPNAQKWH